MIKQIDTEFRNEQTVTHKHDWSSKITSTPCLSSLKKKKKDEVLNFNHIPAITNIHVIDTCYWSYGPFQHIKDNQAILSSGV